MRFFRIFSMTSFPFAVFLFASFLDLISGEKAQWQTSPTNDNPTHPTEIQSPELTYPVATEQYAVYDHAYAPAYDPNYDPAIPVESQAYDPTYDPNYAATYHQNYGPSYNQVWSPDATYDPNYSGEIQDRDGGHRHHPHLDGDASLGAFSYPVGVEVFTHLSERNFILRKILQSIVTYFARNFAWTGVLAAVGAAERVFPQITEWTELEEEDHGHGADAGHALAEVVTTIGHGGFEMLLWGLAGFVNPEKSGKVFEQALGLTVTDEFFKDNAIESGGTLMFWAVMGFFYFLLNIL